MYFLGEILKLEITLTETAVLLVQIASQQADNDFKKLFHVKNDLHLCGLNKNTSHSKNILFHQNENIV